MKTTKILTTFEGKLSISQTGCAPVSYNSGELAKFWGI